MNALTALASPPRTARAAVRPVALLLRPFESIEPDVGPRRPYNHLRHVHRMPFGPVAVDDADPGAGFKFRIWAPGEARLRVRLINQNGEVRESLCLPEGGWHQAVVAQARPGDYYSFVTATDLEVPDPASRFNPGGVHAPSLLVDPGEYAWDPSVDEHWAGRPWSESVIYELHVGTFTPEGTFNAAEAKLDYLAGLGFTAIELMPVAAGQGRRGWGYDGTLLYAPHAAYGSPSDLKNFVQAAHRRGLMVYLDVVYNHFGPEGNYLCAYAPEFFSAARQTPWGQAIAFGGKGQAVVRDFFIHNALFWLHEYRFDGLRLDAVHQIFDDSRPDFLAELADRVRSQAGARHIHLMLENADNAASRLQSFDRQAAYDAQWNDDFHHAAHVLLTGETQRYYADYADAPIAKLSRSLAEGFAFQGEFSAHDGRCRGESTAAVAPVAFVNFLQNHDHVGNRAFGGRIADLTAPHKLRALVALQLLGPAPPMVFMGEEFGSTTPFLYFCDPAPERAAAVREGREREFGGFGDANGSPLPDPAAVETFLASKLDWPSLGQVRHQEWLEFYARLLAVRQRVIVPVSGRLPAGPGRCVFMGPEAFEIRWPHAGDATLVMRTNLGDEVAGGFPPMACAPVASVGAVHVPSGSLGGWSVEVYVVPQLR